jgi:3-oxoacyl-[acyl-carrier protein] reductase
VAELEHPGVAVVTGGSRGIGAAIAAALRETGRPVATLARSGADVACDVSDPASVKEAFAAVREQHGPVAVLVNNAGITRDGLAVRMPDEDWRAVLDVDLTGPFLCTKEGLADMMKARWGRIVNVSSVVAERANAGQANYVAAKAGLLGYTRVVAREMGRRGICVNAVTPGLIDTDMTGEGVGEGLVEAIPARRTGRPEEVAHAVRFLCSEEASYINGATLAIDGGLGA